MLLYVTYKKWYDIVIFLLVTHTMIALVGHIYESHLHLPPQYFNSK